MHLSAMLGLGTLLLGALMASAAHGLERDVALTPRALETALSANPSGADAEQLANNVRALFGKDALAKGHPKIEGLTVAFALDRAGLARAPEVVSDDNRFHLALKPIGGTSVYAAATTLPEGSAARYHWKVEGEPIEGGQFEVYTPPAESRADPSVPHGVVTPQAKWHSKIFDGTERDWWVYVPAQYKAETPACVMIFQDGQWYKDRVAVVFDNLIARGEMPVTVAVFINPGKFADGRDNRSFEYDTLSDQYSRFLLEEILPEVEKTRPLRHDAPSRAVAGISSGGICAFTVAWERPDQFHKVLSWVGSFTGIASGKTLKEGGNTYPVLIRKSPHKEIRIFQQDGANDLDNVHGNWPLANQEMNLALEYARYDHKFVFGQGFHSDNHGYALLPDSLRWLWRDYKP